MKMRDLEFLGVPSYIANIWEKNYSRYLLAIQEEAVRYYGVLNYNGSDGIAALSSKARNDNISPSPCPLLWRYLWNLL